MSNPLAFLAPSPLEAAHEAIRRGWYVFPLIQGSKRPAVHGWPDASTRDARKLDRWAEQYPGCNWGLDCGKSGLAVLDLDAKNGKDGQNSLLLLETEHNARLLRDTFTVQTPSGGRHLYYLGEIRSAVNVRPGLDTRGRGGYVVLYGSALPEGDYVIANGSAVAPLPSWLAGVIGRGTPRSTLASNWLTEPDKPEYISAAIDWLVANAPESVQGEGGDDTLVKRVFQPLRDRGISQDKAVELVALHYNDVKAFPPWTFEELERKAANAYRYALSPAGNATPEGKTALLAAAFGPVPQQESALNTPTPAPGTSDRPSAASIPFILASEIDEPALPRRNWVMGRRFLRGYLTGTISPGGVGKSILTYLEALAVATGKPLCGEPVQQPGPCVLFNAEDPADELRMRLVAVCKHYKIDHRDLGGKHHQIYLVSGRDMKLRVVSVGPDRQSFVPSRAAVATLEAMIQQTKAVLFVGDPFVRLHDCPENDNVAMDKVVEVFTDVAHRLNVAVHLVHHTRKRGNSGGEGDADTARGASSFVNALRLAHTLSTMSEEDAKTYGVGDTERTWFVRLDDAKINLAPPTTEVRWYKKIDVTLANGEHVGTMQRVTLESVVKASQYGQPVEIERAGEIVRQAGPLGTEMGLPEVGRLIVDTAKGEMRSAATVANAIRNHIRKNGPAVLGEVALHLTEKAHGMPRFWLHLAPVTVDQAEA